MDFCYITFRSVTSAQRGERVLEGGGIRCNLQRTPRWMEEQGCGYCLRLSADDCPGAAALLKKARVPFRKVYRLGEKGNMEEARL